MSLSKKQAFRICVLSPPEFDALTCALFNHWCGGLSSSQALSLGSMKSFWLSMDEGLIQIVNYFQKYSIGLLKPRDTYMWYRDIIPKKKRFNKYIKGKKAMKYDSELITTICKYYETSKNECIEYIEMMDKKQLTSILELHGKEPKQIKKLLKGKK